MKKLLLVSLCFLMLSITQVFAQNRTVTGTVTAKDDGLPIPGVTVKVKGSSNGTQTNTAGKFTLSVPAGATLQFSAIGYNVQTLTPKGEVVNVALQSASTALGEVVVTGALGVKTQAKNLGYATANVTPKELTATAAVNVANGLTGKVAGLAVYELDNSIDPQISIVLRGNRSLEGNNNALIVLDGVPLPAGTLLSSINPNDVADVNILKGAGAAAIYGSEASNGAVIITTKRGTSTGKPVIVYQNSVQAEKVAFYPKLQTTFGPYGGEPNYVDPNTGFTEYVPYENQEYGPAYNGQLVPLGAPLDSANGKQLMVPYKAYPTSPIKAFFQTGITEQNDISYSQGDAQNSIFISAQNSYRTSIVPLDKNIRNAFSVRGHRTSGIFSIDYSVGYTKTNISTYINNGTATGSNNILGLTGSYVTNAAYNDLYASVLQLPAFLNIAAYKNPASDIANPNNYYDAYAINPYWVINNARRNINRDVLLSSLKLQVDPTSWLSASYHLSDNFGNDQERYTRAQVNFSPYATSDYYGASNVPSGFKSTGISPGMVYDYSAYGDGSGNPDGYSRIQGDAIVDLHHTFLKDFKTSLLLGNSIYQQYSKIMYTGSSQLLIPDFYNVAYIGGQPNTAEGTYTIRNVSYFGDLNIGYKGYLNLEATLRNEQDSRLSPAERSFTYPSVKLAFVPTDAFAALKDNNVLSFAKIYGSLSRVGNINLGPYEIFNTYNVGAGFPYGSLGGLTSGAVNYSPTLKPEITTASEAGLEVGLFKSRVDFTATYYNEFDKNQTVTIYTSSATGYNASILNIGKTQSQGYEFQLTGQILTQDANKFGWTVGGNFSINNSKVVELINGVSSLNLGNNQYAVKGQPFPLLEGTDFVRDPQGKVVVSATTGYPTTAQGLTSFGRTTPKYDFGVNTNLSYKFVSLSAVAEYRGGDVIYNAIGQTLTFTGASEYSASAGRQRFIYPNSVIQTGANTFVPNNSVSVADGNYGFWQTSNFSKTMSPFVSSGAFWKIREINLTFNLNQFINRSHFVKGLSVALTGRNLWLFTPKSNSYTDPEFSDASPTSSTRGVNDQNELPGTRVFGGSVKVTF
jgi:TonB-linked SusC/RagA family outer membrane protein